MIGVRLATHDDDLDALNAGDPMWEGAAQLWRTHAAAPPDVPLAILVGELDGRPVATSTAVGAPISAFGYGIGSVWVQPAARRCGVGGPLYERVVEVVRSAGVCLAVSDDQPEGLAAAMARGLEVLGHHVESSLVLADLPNDVVTAAVQRADATGHVLEQLADTEQAWSEAYAFLGARLLEAPDTREGGGNLPYSVFRGFLAEPWQVLLARRDGALTGITGVIARPVAGSLNIQLTGVLIDAAGEGVSMALKAEHGASLRDAGWTHIVTQNMDQNAAIRAVNARLGFTVTGGASDVGTAFG